jgi:DNA topoisomerase-2
MDVEDQDQVEEFKEGEIDSKEYDYLLSMALWSLTEERVDDLIRQMNSKKNEHDTLEKMHIY